MQRLRQASSSVCRPRCNAWCSVMTEMKRSASLPRSFCERDTKRVARELLGCVLETRIRSSVTAGRIVEVEAYLGPDDPASHSADWLRTARNEAMYGPPGTAYVYRSYGVHWCFNVVTEQQDFPAAVLVRALEPVAGIRTMARRRGRQEHRLLCSGPGKLCQALAITDAFNRVRLHGPRIRIRLPQAPASESMASGPRIGVSRAAGWPLRFFMKESPWLSRRA